MTAGEQPPVCSFRCSRKRVGWRVGAVVLVGVGAGGASSSAVDLAVVIDGFVQLATSAP